MNAQKIKQAMDFRSEQQPEKALEILLSIHKGQPLDPEINYQIAWTYDSMGLERDAVAYYETALANGLTEGRAGAYLGLGSTYRCLGEYQKSVDVFDRALQEFPAARDLQVFRALTLYNLGRHSEGMGVLLDQLLDTTGDAAIKRYNRALREYAHNLDQVWD